MDPPEKQKKKISRFPRGAMSSLHGDLNLILIITIVFGFVMITIVSLFYNHHNELWPVFTLEVTATWCPIGPNFGGQHLFPAEINPSQGSCRTAGLAATPRPPLRPEGMLEQLEYTLVNINGNRHFLLHSRPELIVHDCIWPFRYPVNYTIPCLTEFSTEEVKLFFWMSRLLMCHLVNVSWSMLRNEKVIQCGAHFFLGIRLHDG